MKISEYLQLDEALNAQGTSVAKELGLTPLNEAPAAQSPTTKPENVATKLPKTTAPVPEPTEQKLDTETQTLSLLTRWGRMKAKLNRSGQKIQKDISKNVIGKYLPTVLETEKQTLNAIAAAAKQNKGIDGIKQILKLKQDQGGALQKKQMEAMYAAIDQSLANTSARLDKTIDSSQMTDKNKADVKNYWVLLSTQIKMNAYTYIAQTINASAKAIIGANANILKAYQENDVIIADVRKKRKEAEGEIKTQKETLKSTTPEASTVQADPIAIAKSDIGKTYTYTDPTDKSVSQVTISHVDDSARVFITKPDGTSKRIEAGDVAKVLSPPAEKTAEPAPAANANPAETKGI